MSIRARLLVAITAALLLGVGGPLLDVTLKCRRSRERVLAACPVPNAPDQTGCPATSEECVWGRSLLPISIAAGLLLLGLPVGGFVYWRTGPARKPPP